VVPQSRTRSTAAEIGTGSGGIARRAGSRGSEEVGLDLSRRFSGGVERDTRQGYAGWTLRPDWLLDVARALRDEGRCDYLSSITGVDYLPENAFEIVYHFYSTEGGPGVTLKTRVPRESPFVPSLTPLFPGA
jgi:NADH:ubiquinone oxidoreductase subunit C